ncbi:MAG TPA: phytanoyl-CoA dioxygenase family protein [Cytophagaceae bacterium]
MSFINFIRRFKISYSLYNIFQFRRLKYIQQQYKKRGIRKRYFSSVQASDFKGLEAEKPWLDEKNSQFVLPNNANFRALPVNLQQVLLPWSEKGYAIIRNFFTPEMMDKINEEIESMLASGEVAYRYRNKIMFAYKKSETIKQAGLDKQLKNILELLLGREVILFQSINFITGSEQAAHSDTIHMTTHPLGFLIAVWVALEDIDEDNGPLFYYPGSHKLPYILNTHYNHGGTRYQLGKTPYKNYEEKIQQVIQENTFEKHIFKAKKGDILIWHANLLHGGEIVNNKARTRKSMVFHYYAKDVVCYHEITQRPALIDSY